MTYCNCQLSRFSSYKPGSYNPHSSKTNADSTTANATANCYIVAVNCYINLIAVHTVMRWKCVRDPAWSIYKLIPRSRKRKISKPISLSLKGVESRNTALSEWNHMVKLMVGNVCGPEAFCPDAWRRRPNVSSHSLAVPVNEAYNIAYRKRITGAHRANWADWFFVCQQQKQSIHRSIKSTV